MKCSYHNFLSVYGGQSVEKKEILMTGVSPEGFLEEVSWHMGFKEQGRCASVFSEFLIVGAKAQY